jgi:hypothetical protein
MNSTYSDNTLIVLGIRVYASYFYGGDITVGNSGEKWGNTNIWVYRII